MTDDGLRAPNPQQDSARAVVDDEARLGAGQLAQKRIDVRFLCRS